jgi:hypothetical protein
VEALAQNISWHSGSLINVNLCLPEIHLRCLFALVLRQIQSLHPISFTGAIKGETLFPKITARVNIGSIINSQSCYIWKFEL